MALQPCKVLYILRQKKDNNYIPPPFCLTYEYVGTYVTIDSLLFPSKVHAAYQDQLSAILNLYFKRERED